MDNHIKKILDDDTNGLLTYEYIANNMGTVDADLPALVDNMIMKDRTGQFVVSTARYLASSLWGSDYKEHAAELSAKDDNFRRIYKRLYPVGI